MMRLIHRDVKPENITNPRQKSGTCWFFAAVSALFISDLGRKHSIPLRETMISGIKHPYTRSDRLNDTLLRFNMMIQSITDGDGVNEDDMINNSLIRENEDVVLGLHDEYHNPSTDDSRFASLNDGSSADRFIVRLIRKLIPDKDEMIHVLHEKRQRRPGVKTIMVYHKLKDISTKIQKFDGNTYILDAILFSSNGHAIAGITIGGSYFIVDSNYIAREVDWMNSFEKKEPFTFKKREYEFQGEQRHSYLYRLVE